jgi:lysophospholipase L1-like esterase
VKRALVLGDSIARGDGASTPDRSFVRRFCSLVGIEQIYFFCRGGATSTVGADWARYVWCEPAPALIVVAYGMNDQTAVGVLRRRPRVTAHRFGNNIAQLVQRLRERWRDVDILIVAPCASHPGWRGSSGKTEQYRDEARRVAEAYGCKFADVTTRWCDALRVSSPDDLFDNRMNHPSDLGHAVYLEALLEAYPSSEAAASGDSAGKGQ